MLCCSYVSREKVGMFSQDSPLPRGPYHFPKEVFWRQLLV